jgi:hypothetical protein
VHSFIGTNLHEYLRQRRVTQVFIAGLATSLGVESTARSAYDYGYNVVIMVDAVTDRDADVHRNSVERIFPRLAEVVTTDDVLKALKEPLTSGRGARGATQELKASVASPTIMSRVSSTSVRSSRFGRLTGAAQSSSVRTLFCPSGDPFRSRLLFSHSQM